ncbi:OprD family porin [Pseudomonas sp. AN-1]|uniref:OprD family porin n=1 Tax=Pseudomonas sp. AN-1 TaxID=3096605 RepID=UPI002A6AB701|nr:OprD family porin [Pseudomonas sp. AN-1]WPP45024.1 OprD family porin [Pseudomonas sp. AN-1]
MIRTSQRSKLALGILAAAMAVPAVSQAALVEDSKASLELRNMYLNRDFRDETTGTPANPRSYGELWGQGFIAKFESGYTDGVVGVGVDALGLVGVKLDSGAGRRDGNMMALETDGAPVDNSSQLGLTAKARISKSTLHVGTLQPLLPVVLYNNTRLLPGTYTGGLITSQEVTGLTLHAARLTEYSLRDSTDREDFEDSTATLTDKIDHFDLAGGSYAFNPQLTASYYYGRYDTQYKQHFGGLVHKLPLGDGISLTSDLRYFQTDYDAPGAAKLDDNKFVNGMFTLAVGAHKFGAGFQNMSGDGVLGLIAGADPYSTNLSTYWTFNREDEDAWQVRYDYDFASLGVPGLAFMTRYVSGYNIEQPSGSGQNDGKEWERDTDIVYTLQDGSLKGLRFHLRNVTYRSGGVAAVNARDVDENRVIVSYTLPLL